jgi:cardiolipin synthase
MRLRANHITALRIVMLPLPYFLLYGGKWARVSAIAAFSLLGLTDYLDGLLARRDGSTQLGRLLDPIADKIFSAVTLVPLVDLHILPLWIVWPIFLREFLVTELRRFLTIAKRELPVTEIAKIKTTLQMTGAGLVLLTDTFPDKTVSVAFLSGALLATVFLAVGLYWRDGFLSTRIRTALALLSLGLVIPIIFDARGTILVYGLIILGITVVSGMQYVAAGLPVCLKQGITAVAKVVSTIALPLLVLALMPSAPREMTVLVVLILSVEFGTQGLDMWALQEGERDISWIKTGLLVPATILISVAAGILDRPAAAIPLFLNASAVICAGYAIWDVWLHRRLFSPERYA